jgi:hypothetical protein
LDKLSRLQLPKLEKGGLTTWNHAVCCRENLNGQRGWYHTVVTHHCNWRKSAAWGEEESAITCIYSSSGPTRSRVRRVLRFLPEGFEFQCKHWNFVFSIFDEAHLSRLKFEQRQIYQCMQTKEYHQGWGTRPILVNQRQN